MFDVEIIKIKKILKISLIHIEELKKSFVFFVQIKLKYTIKKKVSVTF